MIKIVLIFFQNRTFWMKVNDFDSWTTNKLVVNQ